MMDFAIIPDILKNASMDSERPRDLRQMGELLKIAYELTGHPVLKNWQGHEPIDLFGISNFDAEKFKRFNPTIIERTISQSVYYSQVQSDHAILIMRSKGIEYSIIIVEDFFITANKIYQRSEAELQQMGASVNYFRLTGAGELRASISYFMEICNNLIELKQKHLISDRLLKIGKDDDKVKFLLRNKADLFQHRDQFDEKVFNHVIEMVDIELNYYKDVKEYLDIPVELRDIINQFLSEKKARISNNKLLGLLLEEKFDEFCIELTDLILQLFSYHDIGGQEPEKVYHAFLLGVFNSFKDSYKLLSNKEAGKGRFDILLIPDTLENRGIIIEVKRSDVGTAETNNSLTEEALKQIVDNKYAIELKMLGHHQYIGMAAVFFGKNLFMKYQQYSIP